MPKNRYPIPDCEYERADVEDALAAVFISVHLSGTHTAATTAPHLGAMTKVEKVWCPTVSAAGSSEEWSNSSHAGTIMFKRPESLGRTESCSCSSAAMTIIIMKGPYSKSQWFAGLQTHRRGDSHHPETCHGRTDH